MFYKQKDSGGRIIAVGTTVDNVILPDNYIQISKSEYDSFQRVFDIVIDTPTITPINEKGELIYASV